MTGQIGACIEGILLGRHQNRQRPAAGTGHGLADGHIDGVNIRTLLPVHLDADKRAVQDPGDLFVFKRFMGHHVTPVAGRVADA